MAPMRLGHGMVFMRLRARRGTSNIGRGILVRLFAAVVFATAAGPAAAQSCDAQCVAAQAADQESLLLPFASLLNTPEGLALLAANLSTEETIYLNATQAQRATSGTVAIIQDVSANILIGAFPNNPNFHYDAAGLPTAPTLPTSVLTAVHAMLANTPIVPVKTFFGQPYDIYGNAYGDTTSDPNGNPAPFAVSSVIASHPFTPENSSLLAYQVQQTNIGGYGQSWQSSTAVADFPSAHAIVSGLYSLTYAILAPGYYQQLVQEWADIGYARNVFGVHYPLDIIGGRIETEYVVAQTLAGSPIYPSTTFTPATLASLSQTMQSYLGGGGSSPYAAACASSVAACVANGAIPTAATYAAAIQNYTYYLTYDLPSVGDTTLAAVVPAAAHWLIATRFPYLDTAQLDEILATTELPSGVPLDDGSGWARLNLYKAASGYGAFRADVTVTMNAANGGLNAFDIWSNAISGPGGLTLKGSGTLILAGNNSYSGGTSVQGGTLAVTGTLGGNLTIASGATFVSNGGYAVASNATLTNMGTYVAVNTPLVNAGNTSNTGIITGDVRNSGSFANNAVVTGAFANAGLLSGNGSVGSLSLLSGSTVAPGNSVGTIQVTGNLTVAPGASYQVQIDTASTDLIQVGGTATLSGGTIVPTVIGGTQALGSSRTILTAVGGVSGSFSSLSEPASGLAPGTRFDALYGANAVSLVVTPTSYANLTGIAETSSESAIGAALDAIRLAPGVAMDSAHSALFAPLYRLPAASITTALDELTPSIYADAMMTSRSAWNLMAGAVGGQLAARRGLDPDRASGSMPGPRDSTIWFNGLAGYASVNGSSGFGAALGGAAVGIDMPVSEAGRLGAAIATANGNTWSDGKAITSAQQVTLYGQWLRAPYFAEMQLGTMYERADMHRSLPLFGATAQGKTEGLAGGGSVRVGVQQTFGAWLIEPSLGFGGFNLQLHHLNESGLIAQAIGGATLGSAQSTLAVSAQRVFALSDAIHMTATGRMGWSHEFADNQARISASFASFSGSGFSLTSASIGRDAAVVGLSTDIKVPSWPGALFVGYSAAFNGNSQTQSLHVGMHFVW
jgi:autotransporter-associated beta strand protein